MRQHAPRKRRRIDRYTIINAFLLMLGIAGGVVMTASLAIALSGLIARHGQLATEFAVPTATPTPSSTALNPAQVENTRTYTFNTKSDLAAFKQSGSGSVSITPGHRMQIKTVPGGTKKVSLTVTVDGQSTVSFDDEVSSEPTYDTAQFLIDGVSQFVASGHETGNHKYQVYQLTPGQHTLTWEYTKDYTIADGSDSYYVDNISITHVFTNFWLKGG